MSDRLARGLFKTLHVLRDYLPEIVVGGGWASFLYHRYLFRDSDRDPVFTRDIDLMVKPVVPVIGDRTIDKVLREAGLQHVFKSTDNPALIHYQGRIDGLEVEIEFLTDLTGSETAVVKKVQPDLHAEALRYVSLAVGHVTELTIDDFTLADGKAPMIVRVPTPAAYIFHKGMIYGRRVDPRKGDKDLYYIFEILAGCGRFKTVILRDLRGLSSKHPGWFRRFIGQIETDFADPGSDGVLRVLSQRPPNAFPGLDDDQFRQFVLVTFREARESLRLFGT